MKLFEKQLKRCDIAFFVFLLAGIGFTACLFSAWWGKVEWADSYVAVWLYGLIVGYIIGGSKC